MQVAKRIYRKTYDEGVKWGKSKYMGVTWNKERRKWMAQININGKRKYLGVFLIEEDAAAIYQKALKEIN